MSICDKCVHREVCCDEGMGEEALNFCAHLLEERPKGKWEFVQYDGNSNIGNWHCTNCRGIRIDNRVDHIDFCNKCGADMRGDENA